MPRPNSTHLTQISKIQLNKITLLVDQARYLEGELARVYGLILAEIQPIPTGVKVDDSDVAIWPDGKSR